VRFKPETKTLRDGGCTSNAMISGVVDLTQQPHVPLSSMTLCRRSLCALPRIRPRTTSSGQIEEPPLSSLVIVSLHQLEACGNTSPASVPKFSFPSRTLYQSSYLPQYSLAGFSHIHSNPLGARKNGEEDLSFTATHLPLPTDIASRFPIRIEPRRSFP
jgi:hypothetical protein